MTACVAAGITNNLWFGVLVGVVTGAFYGVVHGVLSIKYKVNQIISGTAINIFSMGITSYISAKFLQPIQELAAATSAIARGDRERTVSLPDRTLLGRRLGQDDLAILAQSIRDLTEHLRNLESNLEGRIAERTQELERRSAQLRMDQM